MELPVYDERGGAFARLRDRRVLIYWPHGLGDFVHLSYVAPLLEPSNTYYLTRFGDDFVHLYDEDAIVNPLYSGQRAVDDGSSRDARHLGVNFKKIRNREMRLNVPEPLRSRMEAVGIDAVLYTDYPEYEGQLAFPFHTKARALARDLVTPERLASFDLRAPLPSSLRFTAPAQSAARIEERLRECVGRNERLVVVAAGGHTNLKKIWPEEEVQRFARLLRTHDPLMRVVTIDERRSESIGRERGLAPTTQDLFGDLDVPFAHVLLSLLRASAAFIGVASGPLHAALAMGGRPIVGIWLAHFPDWYDEPREGSIHLAGPSVYAKKLDRRKATLTKPAEFRARVIPFPREVPSAPDALEALKLLR